MNFCVIHHWNLFRVAWHLKSSHHLTPNLNYFHKKFWKIKFRFLSKVSSLLKATIKYLKDIKSQNKILAITNCQIKWHHVINLWCSYSIFYISSHKLTGKERKRIYVNDITSQKAWTLSEQKFLWLEYKAHID